jgi:hypothetical protein
MRFRLLTHCPRDEHSRALSSLNTIKEIDMLLSNHLRPIIFGAAALISTYCFAETMTRSEYSAAKSAIKADYKVDKTACASSKGNAQDICKEQAKGKEKIAIAELDFKRTGTDSDNNKVAVAKADSTFAVAKEMCDDKSGEAKTLCRTEAKSIHTKALAESKMVKKIGEAKVDEKQDINTANYKVAIEKCESTSGDVKTACVASAKTKYNKN